MLLTREQAYSLLLQASGEVQRAKQDNIKLRFGQVLWNNLPEDLRKKYVGTSKDFFFEGDTMKACDMLFDWYVEEEDIG